MWCIFILFLFGYIHSCDKFLRCSFIDASINFLESTRLIVERTVFLIWFQYLQLFPVDFIGKFAYLRLKRGFLHIFRLGLFFDKLLSLIRFGSPLQIPFVKGNHIEPLRFLLWWILGLGKWTHIANWMLSICYIRFGLFIRFLRGLWLAFVRFSQQFRLESTILIPFLTQILGPFFGSLPRKSAPLHQSILNFALPASQPCIKCSFIDLRCECALLILTLFLLFYSLWLDLL